MTFTFPQAPKGLIETHLPLDPVGFLEAKIVVTEWPDMEPLWLSDGKGGKFLMGNVDWYIAITCGGGIKGWGDWVYKKVANGKAATLEAAIQQATEEFQIIVETKPLGFWVDIALAGAAFKVKQ